MGLDAVEIVLRAEELFVITIGDDEAAAVRTVGDFYNLICSKLNVTPLPSPITSAELPEITHKEKTLLFLSKYTPLPAPPEVLPWSSQKCLGGTRRHLCRPASAKTGRYSLSRPHRPGPRRRLKANDLHLK